MSNYDNTNQGVLFRNDDKQKDTHPDYRGSVNVDGTEFWLSAWIKTSQRDGSKFMSLSVRKKDGQKPSANAPKNDSGKGYQAAKEGQSARQHGGAFDDMDDDIPF